MYIIRFSCEYIANHCLEKKIKEKKRINKKIGENENLKKKEEEKSLSPKQECMSCICPQYLSFSHLRPLINPMTSSSGISEMSPRSLSHFIQWH